MSPQKSHVVLAVIIWPALSILWPAISLPGNFLKYGYFTLELQRKWPHSTISIMKDNFDFRALFFPNLQRSFMDFNCAIW